MEAHARRLSFLFIVMMMMSLSLPALSQDRGDREGDRGSRAEMRERWENASEEEREEMREEMRKRMEERRAENAKEQAKEMRERLEMSEEDFELISPMIDKVRTAMRERDMATRGGGRGGPGQRGGGSFGIEQSENGKAASEALAELRQAIEDDDAGDIKSSLAKLRKARAGLDKTLKDAREELRSVSSAKWEAEFVVMGVLD